MKKEFVNQIAKLGKQDTKFIFLTGDVGFNAFEELSVSLGRRFINAGIAEENMVSVAAGMAHMGLHPWVYSICPFVTLKPLEQIRNDICHPNLPVTIVGIGGGYGYGIQGTTHHALEDIGVLATLPNMSIYTPAFKEDLEQIIKRMHEERNPSYLRLNMVPEYPSPLRAYKETRRIQQGSSVTILALGHSIHNVLEAAKSFSPKHTLDIWSITKFPFEMPKSLSASLGKTKKVIVVEEHGKDGGLGQKVAYACIQKHIHVSTFIHLHAHGYTSGLYGSQTYHQKENRLHTEGILRTVRNIYNE